MNIISVPILIDNYVWILYDHNKKCLIVDPGEASPVFKILIKHHFIPVAILLTHHHHDHVNGVKDFLQYFRLPVYGPEETYNKGATQIIKEGDTLKILDHIFRILALPGHTLGHVGFYCAPWLFSGDTIFSGGCGRIFEGTPKEMYTSFQKINQFPAYTIICPAHEYTLKNLNFAIKIKPNDSYIIKYRRVIKEAYLKKESSLPTTLYLERKINLFLRCDDTDLKNKLNIHPTSSEEWHVFAKLREKKDVF